MRAIEDIYYGSLDTNGSQRHYAVRLQKLLVLVNKGEHDFAATMTELQIEQLVRSKAAANELHERNKYIALKNTFYPDVKLMAEVMQARDIPNVD